MLKMSISIASNDTSNNYRIHAINCDMGRWNVKIPSTANRISVRKVALRKYNTFFCLTIWL